MRYRVEYSRQANRDIIRLISFLAQRDTGAARKAQDAIREAAKMLEQFPLSCRKADGRDPTLREMVISFGGSGYVALFKLRRKDLVTIVATRHQLEEDYH